MALRRNIFYKSAKSMLLNRYRNAAVAYSLRKIRKEYTGYAIEVVRDADNATMDIGFNSNDELDTSALLTFLGSDTGYVRTWYFQGLPSEGIDAVQTVKANMPRIVDSGVIEELNGKPALNFIDNQFFDLGGDSRYNTGTAGTYGYVVASLRVLPKTHGLFGKSAADAADARRVSLHNSQANGIVSTRGANLAGNQVSLPSPLINTQSVMYQLIKGDENTVGLNDTTSTGSPSTNANHPSFRYFIGAYGNASGTAPQAGFFLDGKMQELVQFYNDKSAVQFDIRDEINNYYGAY